MLWVSGIEIYRLEIITDRFLFHKRHLLSADRWILYSCLSFPIPFIYIHMFPNTDFLRWLADYWLCYAFFKCHSSRFQLKILPSLISKVKNSSGGDWNLKISYRLNSTRCTLHNPQTSRKSRPLHRALSTYFDNVIGCFINISFILNSQLRSRFSCSPLFSISLFISLSFFNLLCSFALVQLNCSNFNRAR